MRLHKGQPDKLAMQGSQGRKRLVGHFGFALIDPTPDFLGGTGHLAEQRAAQTGHLLGQSGLGNGGLVFVSIQRSHLVQLPAEIHTGAHIVRAHHGIADDARPLLVFGDPGFQGLIVIGQKIRFGLEEFLPDVDQLFHNVPGLVFGDGPTGHETDAVPVQEVESSRLERAKDAQAFRVGNAFGPQRGEIFRRQFRAAQILGTHLPPGGPEADVQIQGQQIVQNADVGRQGRVHYAFSLGMKVALGLRM